MRARLCDDIKRGAIIPHIIDPHKFSEGSREERGSTCLLRPSFVLNSLVPPLPPQVLRQQAEGGRVVTLLWRPVELVSRHEALLAYMGDGQGWRARAFLFGTTAPPILGVGIGPYPPVPLLDVPGDGQRPHAMDAFEFLVHDVSPAPAQRRGGTLSVGPSFS